EIVRFSDEEWRHDGGKQEQCPDRRGYIGHNALDEDEAAPRLQAGPGEQPPMLEISLAPPPVALGVVDDILRPFLERAFQIGIETHDPSGARQKRGLDIIMAEDMTAERRFAAQCRQPAA